MEKTHWLGREKASLKAAEAATGSQARLIHYDLAGRYGVKAASAETQAIDFANSIPPAINSTANASRQKAQQRERTDAVLK